MGRKVSKERFWNGRDLLGFIVTFAQYYYSTQKSGNLLICISKWAQCFKSAVFWSCMYLIRLEENVIWSCVGEKIVSDFGPFHKASTAPTWTWLLDGFDPNNFILVEHIHRFSADVVCIWLPWSLDLHVHIVWVFAQDSCPLWSPSLSVFSGQRLLIYGIQSRVHGLGISVNKKQCGSFDK